MGIKWTGFEMGIYEHCGPNRSGKSFLSAYYGWFAFNAGMTVYCNCPRDPTDNSVEHIINYPHVDYDPYKLLKAKLYNCYIITDQGEQVMDARTCAKKDVRQLGYFGYQAKKRGLSWHYDTVRHKNIDPRIRQNPDYILYVERIPKNWHLPLKKIRVKLDYAEGTTRFKITNPQDYYQIYNSGVMLHGGEDN